MKPKKYSRITNPATILEAVSNLKEELRKYWYMDSKLARSLEDYIWKDRDCHLIDLLGRTVACHKAHSGVRLRDVHITKHFGEDKPPEEDLIFEFDVELEEAEHNDSKTVKVQAILPASMELNFTKAKFAKWVAERKAARDRHPNHKDMQTIIKLGMKHNVRPPVIDEFLMWVRGSKNG